MVPGGFGDLAQRSLPGEHRGPVAGGPDGVLDVVAASPVEDAGADQLIQVGTELPQRSAILAVLLALAVRKAVRVLLRYGERGREQPRLLASEPQVSGADRGQPMAGDVGVPVLARYADDAGGHPVAELAHGRRTDRGEELVAVGEVPIRGTGHHADHPCRLTKHHGIRAARPSRLQPRLDQAVADAAAPLPLWLVRPRC